MFFFICLGQYKIVSGKVFFQKHLKNLQTFEQ